MEFVKLQVCSQIKYWYLIGYFGYFQSHQHLSNLKQAPDSQKDIWVPISQQSCLFNRISHFQWTGNGVRECFRKPLYKVSLQKSVGLNKSDPRSVPCLPVKAKISPYKMKGSNNVLELNLLMWEDRTGTVSPTRNTWLVFVRHIRAWVTGLSLACFVMTTFSVNFKFYMHESVTLQIIILHHYC